MSKKIFVSYNFNDREVSHTVKSMAATAGGSVYGDFIFVENDVSHRGDEFIEKEIKRTIEQCDSALFIVGNDSHNSPWINREAQLAISRNMKIVITKITGTTGGIPNILKNNDYPIVRWGARDISYYLNR